MITELFITEKVRVADLVPHVANPRKIKEEEKKKLWDRLQKFGLIGIPVRDSDGQIISGNRRCEVLVANGMGDKIIDVRTAVRKLTDQEVKEIMVIENTHAGEWDLEKLKQEFDELVDLDSYGLSMEEIQEQVDETIAEQPQEAEMPIVAKYSEKYDSIIVICNNEIDWAHISEKLNLQKAKCYKSKQVAMQHVITASDLIAVFKKSEIRSADPSVNETK